MGSALFFAPCNLPGCGVYLLWISGHPGTLHAAQHLVVSGPYCYVRNAVYVSVLAAKFGQVPVLGDWRLPVYAVLFWLACHAFVLTLRRTFGAQFEGFCANVPALAPGPRPWQASGPRLQ